MKDKENARDETRRLCEEAAARTEERVEFVAGWRVWAWQGGKMLALVHRNGRTHFVGEAAVLSALIDAGEVPER